MRRFRDALPFRSDKSLRAAASGSGSFDFLVVPLSMCCLAEHPWESVVEIPGGRLDRKLRGRELRPCEVLCQRKRPVSTVWPG